MKIRRIYETDVLLARKPKMKKATLGKDAKQLKKKLRQEEQWMTGEETTLTTSS